MYTEEGVKHVNGVALYYAVVGEGEPIVILHGGPGLSHDYFWPHLEPLAEDYRLIFYDQRGSGRSTGAADPGSLTLDTFVADLAGVRQAFGLDRMNLLGHSWGGLLALHYAIRYPQDLGALLLVDSAPASTELHRESLLNRQKRVTSEDELAMEQIAQSEGFARQDPQTIEALIRLSEAVTFYDHSRVAELSLRLTEQSARNAFLVAEAMGSTFQDYDLHDDLSKITCPTLIVHGDHDPIPLASAQKIGAHIKNAHLSVLERCGHSPFIEARQAFLQAIREFMAQLSGQIEIA